MKTAIIGGGAAGFFSAIELKRSVPDMEVTIFERSKKVLAKVEISGGGRCNCTNSFRDVTDLKQVYPRGAGLLKRLFKQFGHKDAYLWFESHGVPLVTQDDQCVFPKAQDSHAIIDCFMREVHDLGIGIKYDYKIGVGELTCIRNEYDYVVITTGGLATGIDSSPLAFMKDRIIPPVPSLFTFSINDKYLHDLMGVVVENAMVCVPGTKFRSQGPLLITHWGMSGPAILKLSSYGARFMSEANYRFPILVNWTGESDMETVKEYIVEIQDEYKQKQLTSYRPYGLQQRLWDYLVSKLGKQCRWAELGKKDTNRLVDILFNDRYEVIGRYAFKDEFVTCGGVSLDAIDKNTLESKDYPNLFFAGEVLDIDGITGGFNFQAAWTTGYAVAKAIEKKIQ
ncbi:MAG: NAD(P)/FAD-dependent oxidoreductase [Bacteroidaceae bacterium]|nr:NAD(P)/FAD-dependent oxidoreductase [Bacteroidaceae bacterium]